MRIHITLRLSGEPDKRLRRALGEIAQVRRSRIAVHEAEEGGWELVTLLQAESVSVVPSSFRVRIVDIDWQRGPSSDWAAAVLNPGDGRIPANATGDFDPALPPPHLGFLPQGVPLQLGRPPRVPTYQFTPLVLVLSARYPRPSLT